MPSKARPKQPRQNSPCLAIAIVNRATAYAFSLADENAEVMTTALIMSGSTLTLTWRQITTNGEDAAVSPPASTALRSSGSCCDTLRPMIRIERT